jgi:TPR repeat protein
MNMKSSFLIFILAGLCTASIGFAQSAGIDPGLLKKANGGNQAAQVAIGERYDAGLDVPQDLKQAADWYRQAAEKGSIAGEVHLAELYLAGRGVPRDKVRAAELYSKAAEQGDAGAQGTLAMLYVMGQGVQQSDVEAYYWLDLAAAVKTPKQDQYIANRQNVGSRITVEELQAVQERVAKWRAARPR